MFPGGLKDAFILRKVFFLFLRKSNSDRNYTSFINLSSWDFFLLNDMELLIYSIENFTEVQDGFKKKLYSP